MHYVIAFEPRRGAVNYFSPTPDSKIAMQERFAMEMHNYRAHITNEMIIVIQAPDLYTLMRHHTRFFRTEYDIRDCFFCRGYLSLAPPEWRVSIEDLDVLIEDAFNNGHCLLCHDPYPVAGMGPERGIAAHSYGCKVRDPGHSRA